MVVVVVDLSGSDVGTPDVAGRSGSDVGTPAVAGCATLATDFFSLKNTSPVWLHLAKKG